MAKLVSKVYGDALFSLALEENKLESIWKESVLMKQILEENPEFLSVLCHPEMTQEKKTSALLDVFGQDVSKEIMGLLNIMVKKGRIGEINSVLDYFDVQVKEYLKIGVVEVSTPMPLSEDQKKQIENKLLEVSEYETVSVDYQVDESLLGGIVIRIGNRVLDNSIRSKLDTMARELSKVKLSS
ncbi:MAG: F0F1 ATP synthase subunit delta [Lachnospiraceae bacterium]|nr:F0F1 ATP synthase subunit delta [Lachnospiraceae bacterium]